MDSEHQAAADISLDPAIQSRLSIVIPAFNEAEGIGHTLRALRTRLPLAEIIVIDDGSSDATASVARGISGVHVLQHPFNRGYGAGIKSGMRTGERAFVAWFDADNEHRVDDLIRLCQRLDAERLAAVIGSRGRGGPMVRTVGKAMIWLMARSLRFKFSNDLNCGLRVFRRAVIAPYLHLFPDGYSASMTSTLVMLERGYPIAFEPITTNPRIGRSKVRLADGFRTMLLTLRMVMLFAPLRVFVPMGLAALVAGSAYGIGLALVSGRGLPVSALFLMVGGILLMMLGLIADQISQLRLSQLEAMALRQRRQEALQEAGDGD
jgi:hypothetical protein